MTAKQPIMRTVSGTWIAHGSGCADRNMVDANDHVQVPPDQPAYTIHRAWLSAKEEASYYYDFCNEGLWPLCHIAPRAADISQQRLDAYYRRQPQVCASSARGS